MKYSFNGELGHVDDPQLDIVEPEFVDVQVDSDRRTLWVNVDGFCALRICRPKARIRVEVQGKLNQRPRANDLARSGE